MSQRIFKINISVRFIRNSEFVNEKFNNFWKKTRQTARFLNQSNKKLIKKVTAKRFMVIDVLERNRRNNTLKKQHSHINQTEGNKTTRELGVQIHKIEGYFFINPPL